MRAPWTRRRPEQQRSAAEPTEALARAVELSDDEWRARLSPQQYTVLRQQGTEPAWSGALLHAEGSGVFTCAGCGAELFPSSAKFESGTGWPSFFLALREGAIEEHEDRSLFMRRTEIVCARCGGHLGHVFPDGPRPTGLRYCVNSLSLDFVPEGTASEQEPEASSPDEPEPTHE